MNAAPYTPLEERLHALIHGLGFVCGLVAMPWLLWIAASGIDPWRAAGALVFSLSAMLVFATSTLYHRSTGPQARQRWRTLDHAAIYLLIAGSYTPFTIGVLRGAWGWSLFGAVWGIAVLGIIAKTTVGFRFPKLSTALYLAMGWAGIVAIKPMMQVLSSTTLAWIAAGGLLYTAGVPFYVWKSRRYTHAVWHLMVLGGVCCHFMAVRSVLLPLAAPGLVGLKVTVSQRDIAASAEALITVTDSLDTVISPTVANTRGLSRQRIGYGKRQLDIG